MMSNHDRSVTKGTGQGIHIPSVTFIGPEGDQQGHSKGGCGEGQRKGCRTLLLSEVWKAMFLLQQTNSFVRAPAVTNAFVDRIFHINRRF